MKSQEGCLKDGIGKRIAAESKQMAIGLQGYHKDDFDDLSF